MGQVNVYVPDELKERLEMAGLARQLSPLARMAWERELDRREEADRMDEIRVDAADRGAEVELRFAGKEIYGGVYERAEGGAVLVFEEDYFIWSEYEIADNEEAFADDVLRCLVETLGHPDPREEYEGTLRAFGVKPIVRL